MFKTMLPVLALIWPSIGWAETIFPGYEWRMIDSGIYLHTQEDPFAGPVDGNSIVIINDNDVVVVDTHINPAAARAVVEKIKSITNNPVSLIINTHWHDDHVNGNHTFQNAFPDAEILAHPYTAEKLSAEWREFEESRQNAYETVTVDRLLEAANAVEADDPTRAMGIRIYAGYVGALKPELPNLQLAFPTKLVLDPLEIQRGDRTIQVRWVGKGNTEGDLIVALPKEKIVITGDILVAPIPYAFDSPMLDWAATLEQLDTFDAETIIPGHGKPQTNTQYLNQVIDLLAAITQQVAAAAENGVAFEDLEEAIDLSKYREMFTAGAPDAEFAWQSYFLQPGLKSTWVSLGHALPDEE